MESLGQRGQAGLRQFPRLLPDALHLGNVPADVPRGVRHGPLHRECDASKVPFFCVFSGAVSTQAVRVVSNACDQREPVVRRRVRVAPKCHRQCWT
eukprot:4053127-Pyramimonas_sp.AAC.1